jgi:hypothetical protein
MTVHWRPIVDGYQPTGPDKWEAVVGIFHLFATHHGGWSVRLRGGGFEALGAGWVDSHEDAPEHGLIADAMRKAVETASRLAVETMSLGGGVSLSTHWEDDRLVDATIDLQGGTGAVIAQEVKPTGLTN